MPSCLCGLCYPGEPLCCNKPEQSSWVFWNCHYWPKSYGNLELKTSLVRWNATFNDLIRTMAICYRKHNATIPCSCELCVGSFTLTRDRVMEILFFALFDNENHQNLMVFIIRRTSNHLMIRWLLVRVMCQKKVIMNSGLHFLPSHVQSGSSQFSAPSCILWGLHYKLFLVVPANDIQQDERNTKTVTSRFIWLHNKIVGKIVNFSMAIVYPYAETYCVNIYKAFFRVGLSSDGLHGCCRASMLAFSYWRCI